jgi:hypothetical protein
MTVDHERPLPHWAEGTVGVLSTSDGRIRAEPVAAFLRAGDRRVLVGVDRGSPLLARMGETDDVALTVLGDRGVSFTARGRARLLAGSLAQVPDLAVLELAVDAIDDHRRIGYGVRVLFTDGRRLEVLREEPSELEWLVA